MNRPLRQYRALILLGVLFASLPSLVRGETLSIEQLNEKVAGWKAGKKEPPPVKYQVEGRALLVAKERVQFRNSPIIFESDEPLPELTRPSMCIEATGMVVRDPETGAYSFRVQSIRELPSDLDRFLEKRRQARSGPPSKWFELGAWAAQRGEFYKDHELIARSEEAYQKGIESERLALARDNPQGFFELAEKARRYKLSEKRAQELLHEGIIILWQSSRRQSGQPLVELARIISERLKGSTTELPQIDVELEKEYVAAPLEVYREADTATRNKLHRILYVDVVLRTILPELKSDGSNGFAIAEKIEKQAGEKRSEIERCKDLALAARSKEVETLSKSDMLALADSLRKRDQPQAAEQLTESWLTLRLRQLEADDTEGLIEVTDDYRALLKRHDLANRLLIDGWVRNQKATDLAERLQQAGYVLHEGTWLTESKYNARPEGRLEQAIRAGRVDPGMTASHVRRSLGEPQRQARSATAGQVSEVWTYDQSNSTRLVVRLQRNRRQTELTVVDVTQAPK